MGVPKGSKRAKFDVQTCAKCGQSHRWLVKGPPLWVLIGSGGKGSDSADYKSFCPKCAKKMGWLKYFEVL